MATIENAGQAMDLIQHELHGVNVKNMAVLTGLSTSAIYRLRRGKTKWPRDTTFFCVTHLLGYEMQLTKRTKQ